MSFMERSSIDAASSIQAVHHELSRKFERADSNVIVRHTGYFNHTYAPDLVLGWRGEKDERHVYLRTSDSSRYLAEDIDLARDRDPIFVPLSGVVIETAPEDESVISLSEKSRSSRALVAEAESIDALASDPSSGAIHALAARAVLQGGAGLIVPKIAHSFSTTIANGFEGALIGDVDLTNGALRQSSELLDDRRLAQVAELLQAAWIGGGQIGTAFPGIGVASSSIEPEGLKLLLDTVSVDDMKFWRRLARGLQLSHLAALDVSPDHEGFQMLMTAAAPRLKAKGARAVELDGQSLTKSRWAVSGGRLVLAFGRSRLEFVPRSIEEFASDGEDATTSVRTFARRAEESELSISRVILSSGDRRLEYSSEDGTSVTGDDRIIALETDIGVGASVLRATVRADGRDLILTMPSSTASGSTRSLFLVSTLASVALPLLTDLDEAERRDLVALFEEEDHAADAGATYSAKSEMDPPG